MNRNIVIFLIALMLCGEAAAGSGGGVISFRGFRGRFTLRQRPTDQFNQTVEFYTPYLQAQRIETVDSVRVKEHYGQFRWVTFIANGGRLHGELITSAYNDTLWLWKPRTGHVKVSPLVTRRRQMYWETYIAKATRNGAKTYVYYVGENQRRKYTRIVTEKGRNGSFKVINATGINSLPVYLTGIKFKEWRRRQGPRLQPKDQKDYNHNGKALFRHARSIMKKVKELVEQRVKSLPRVSTVTHRSRQPEQSAQFYDLRSRRCNHYRGYQQRKSQQKKKPKRRKKVRKQTNPTFNPIDWAGFTSRKEFIKRVYGGILWLIGRALWWIAFIIIVLLWLIAWAFGWMIFLILALLPFIAPLLLIRYRRQIINWFYNP